MPRKPEGRTARGKENAIMEHNNDDDHDIAYCKHISDEAEVAYSLMNRTTT